MAQSITDLKIGKVLNFAGEPFLIVSTSFMRTAQRKPVMKTKLRNVVTGKVLDKTFIAGEAFDMIEIQKAKAQYMYKDQENAYFMDYQTYDQFPLSLETVADAIKFMKEGEDANITKLDGNPISIEMPPKVVLKVIETTPGVRGDTAQGGSKPATMETGVVVNVPLFINEGDNIRVNTDTGEYYERVQG